MGTLEDLFGGFEFKRPERKVVDIAASGVRRSSWLFDELVEVQGLDLVEQPHMEICTAIEDALGDCRFNRNTPELLAIGVPRFSYKTSICAEALPSAILARNPNARILLTAFRHDVAKKRCVAARWHFEHNERFHTRYGDDWKPEFREAPWNDDHFVVAKRDGALIDPSVGTASIGRSMTGSHYDVIIIDDIVTDVNSRTPEERQKAYDHILDLRPVLAPGGVIIMIFTRWHPDDAYGKLWRVDQDRTKRGEKPFWKWIVRSAYNPDDSLYFPVNRRGVPVLTHAFLDEQREIMGSRKFAAQYLLQPIADEDRTFNMDKARQIAFEFIPRDFGGWVMVPRWSNEKVPVLTSLAWDPAGAKYNRKSDAHGITVVGTDPMNRWWIAEAEGLKAPPAAVFDRIIKLLLYYNVRRLSIEDASQQSLWLERLQDEIKHRGLDLSCEFALTPTGNIPKSQRIELLQPKWERNEIILRPTQARLFGQFADFSAGGTLEHEDELDSLVQHLSIAVPASADFLYSENINPVDPQWVARQERLRLEAREKDQGGSIAGRSGTRWAT